MKMPPRELVSGAFTLGAPGTYVSQAGDRLVIGNRPGVVHYSIAVGVPASCVPLLWLFRDAWWLGVGALVLFGLPSTLIAFNTQRYEVTAGQVARRGRAVGLKVERDWPLPDNSAVRIGPRIEIDQETAYQWTCYQAQILTHQGWIPIAESMQREKAVEFAERLSRAAGVRIL